MPAGRASPLLIAAGGLAAKGHRIPTQKPAAIIDAGISLRGSARKSHKKRTYPRKKPIHRKSWSPGQKYLQPVSPGKQALYCCRGREKRNLKIQKHLPQRTQRKAKNCPIWFPNQPIWNFRIFLCDLCGERLLGFQILRYVAGRAILLYLCLVDRSVIFMW